MKIYPRHVYRYVIYDVKILPWDVIKINEKFNLVNSEIKLVFLAKSEGVNGKYFSIKNGK